MINACPNKSSKEWKFLTDNFGENVAYDLYIKNGEVVPSLIDINRILNEQFNINDTILDNKVSENIITSLKKKIEEILSENGISIGVLTELENKQGIENNKINGVFDPINATKNAEGFVELIRIAKGKDGDTSLPEEFAHVVIASLKNNPLYERLYNSINQQELENIFEQDEQGSYNKYLSIYNNIDKMKEEAIGKLVAKHIIRNEQINQSSFKNLLERFKNKFKEIWSKLNDISLEESIHNINKQASDLAYDIMNGKVKINLDYILSDNTTTKLYNLKEKIERNKKIHKKIIDTEHKRLKIFESNKKPTQELKDEIKVKDQQVDNLELMYHDGLYDEGIANSLTLIIDELTSLQLKLDEMNIEDINNPITINIAAGALRDIKSYIDAYNPIIKDILSYYNTKEYKNSDRFSIQNKVAAEELYLLLEKIRDSYKDNAKPLFIKFLKPYFGEKETLDINFGRTIRSYTLENLIDEAVVDIGLIDRMLNSMSDSTDPLLRLIEQPVKEAKFKKRERVNEYIKILKNAQIKLEKAGINDTSFIYKKNKEGKLTGYLIQRIDWGKYNQKKLDKINELNTKYSGKDSGNFIDQMNWSKEYREWLEQNNDKSENNVFTPKYTLYPDNQYSSLNDKQKEFYNNIIDTKIELDKLLPDYKISTFLAPQIRKDFIERLKESDNFSEAINNLKDWASGALLVKEDDTEFGNRKIAGFDNKEVMQLPVFYTNKLEDSSFLSTDIVSSMIMYADMAVNYDELSKIVNTLEIGRDILRDREVGASRNDKPLLENFKRRGRTIENKILKTEGENRIEQRLNDFFESQVYGIQSVDEGNIAGTKISKAKFANTTNFITSLSMIALNPLGAASNILMGKAMMRIESLAGEFFNHKDLVWADATYTKELPGLIMDSNRRELKSKLGLFNEKFNVMQEYEKDIRDVEMNKKNWFLRKFNLQSLYFLQSSGENYMQTRTALSLASNYKLKLNDKEINLWDAYVTVVDEKGISRLILKNGVTKLDGSKFTSKDELAFQNKSKAINQRLHGIYNQEDKNAIQRFWWGKLMIMFRKWMMPSYNRRFQRSMFNNDLDAYTEGYYNTGFQFLSNIVKDLKKGSLDLTANWNNLNNTQKANIKRSMIEIGQFMMILLASTLASKYWDDDKDMWYKNFIIYQLNRLKTEIGVFMPTGYHQIKEGLTLIDSPVAGIKLWNNIIDIIDVTKWGDEIKSGRYKGDYVIEKNLWNLVPMSNTIYKATHPQEAVKFYNQN